MKTGIYGGTFNPIHSGHLHILREFIRRLGLNRVLLIPTGQPPHKDAPLLASREDRLQMCGLAAAEVSQVPVEISTVELDRPGKSYSVDTLALLKQQYPKDELYFLMGEDMFLTVDSWYRPQDICRMAALCASPRSEDGLGKLLAKKRELEEKFAARCFVENIPYLPVSSTQIRERLQNGESVAGLVPEKVEQYLRDRRVYQSLRDGKRTVEMTTYSNYESEVQKHLTPKRFYHSQCVAAEAARLAERYGADVEKARLAGILHDIMKDTPPEEQLKIMEKFGIMLCKRQSPVPKPWHAAAGAAYLHGVLGVDDPEILSAVECHTWGKADMSLLDKVLFVADYISADRDYPGVEAMREAAERSLEEAIVKGVAWTLNDLSGQGRPIDPDSICAYNDALEHLKAGKDLVFKPGRFGFPDIEIKEGEN